MKEYKVKGQRGITDLRGVHAFISTMQGDTSCTNKLSIVNEYHMKSNWFID